MAPRTRAASASGDEDHIPSPRISEIPPPRRYASRSVGQPSVSPTRATQSSSITSQRTTSLSTINGKRDERQVGTPRGRSVVTIEEAESDGSGGTVRANSPSLAPQVKATSRKSISKDLPHIASAHRKSTPGLTTVSMTSPFGHRSAGPLTGSLKDNRHVKAARRSAGLPSRSSGSPIVSDFPKSTSKRTLHLRKSISANEKAQKASTSTREGPRKLTLQERVDIMRLHADHNISTVFSSVMEEEGDEISPYGASRLDWDALEIDKQRIFDVSDVHPFVYLGMLPPDEAGRLNNEDIEVLGNAVDCANLATFLRIICSPNEAASVKTLTSEAAGKGDATTRALTLLRHAFKAFLGVCLPKNHWSTSPAMLSMIDLATQMFLYGAKESDIAGFTLDDLFSPSAVSRLDHWESAVKRFGKQDVDEIKHQAAAEWRDLAQERAKILRKLDREAAVLQYPYDSFRREIIAAISAMQPSQNPSDAIRNSAYVFDETSDMFEEDVVDDIVPNRSPSAEQSERRSRREDIAEGDGLDRGHGRYNRSSSGIIDGPGQLSESEDESRQSEDADEDRVMSDDDARSENQEEESGDDDDADGDADDEDMDGDASRSGRERKESERDPEEALGNEHPSGQNAAIAGVIDPEAFLSAVQGLADSETSAHAAEEKDEEEDPDQGSSWAINKSDAAPLRPSQILGPKLASKEVGRVHKFSKPQKDSVQIAWQTEDGDAPVAAPPLTLTPRKPPRLANAGIPRHESAMGAGAQSERGGSLPMEEAISPTPTPTASRWINRLVPSSVKKFLGGSTSTGGIERSTEVLDEQVDSDMEDNTFMPEQDDRPEDVASDDDDQMQNPDPESVNERQDAEDSAEDAHIEVDDEEGRVEDPQTELNAEEHHAEDSRNELDGLVNEDPAQRAQGGLDGSAEKDCTEDHQTGDGRRVEDDRPAGADGDDDDDVGETHAVNASSDLSQTASLAPRSPAWQGHVQPPIASQVLPLNLTRQPDVPVASGSRGQKRLAVPDDEEDELASEEDAPPKRQRVSRKAAVRPVPPPFVAGKLDAFMVNERGEPLHDGSGTLLQEDDSVPNFVPPFSVPQTQRGVASPRKKGKKGKGYIYSTQSSGTRTRWTTEQCLLLYRQIQVMPLLRKSAKHTIAYHLLGEPSRTARHQPAIPDFNLAQFRDKIKEEVKKRRNHRLPVVGNVRFYLDTMDPRKIAYEDEVLLAREAAQDASQRRRAERLKVIEDSDAGGDESTSATDGPELDQAGSEDSESDGSDHDLDSEDGAPRKRRTSRASDAEHAAPPSPTVSESERAAATVDTGRTGRAAAIPVSLPRRHSSTSFPKLMYSNHLQSLKVHSDFNTASGTRPPNEGDDEQGSMRLNNVGSSSIRHGSHDYL